MKDGRQKVGILFSIPVCIVVTFFVFPIGIILIFMKLYKKGKISKRVKNIGVGIGGAFIVVLVVGVLTLPEVDSPGQVSRPNTATSSPTPSENVSSTPAEEETPPESSTENNANETSTPSPSPSVSAVQETGTQETGHPTPSMTPSTEQAPEHSEQPVTNPPVQVDNPSISYLYWQNAWAKENNMSVISFVSEQQLLSDWLSKNSDGTLRYVKPDNVFGENQYKITREKSNYLYCGEMKDNMPSGYGILYFVSEIGYETLEYENRPFNTLYIGQFEKGRFHGYGLQFSIPKDTILFSLERICSYQKESQEFLDAYSSWVNFVTYEGMFKDGLYNGNGNTYKLDLAFNVSLAPLVPLPDVNKVEFDSVEIGNYKAGELNGECKIYSGTYLWYEGEMSGEKRNGYGREYHTHSNVLEYEGYFKNDMRHGEGTSYDINGNVEYSGRWKNDDYA